MTNELDLARVHQAHEPDSAFVAALEQRLAAILAGATHLDDSSYLNGRSGGHDMTIDLATERPKQRRRWLPGVAALVATAAAVAGIVILTSGDQTLDPTDVSVPVPPPTNTEPPTTGEMSPQSAVEAAGRERLERFLAARIAGTGAEGLVQTFQVVVDPATGYTLPDPVPLLYATTSGAPYERYEIDRMDESKWGDAGGGTFTVRLFADSDATVIEQEFFWGYGELRMDDYATIENGQPILLSHSSFDGELSVSAPSTWKGWFPGRDGQHEYAPGVWFGGLWRPEEYFGSGEREYFGSGERIEFVDPVAYDSWCAEYGGSPLLSGPADAAAIAQQLIADPNFETTPPVAARIGGLAAVSIDVTLAPDGKACGIGMIEISRWIHGLWEPGWRLRLYLVDLPQGMSVQTLAITVVAPENRFEALIAETAPIIDSIKFHAD